MLAAYPVLNTLLPPRGIREDKTNCLESFSLVRANLYLSIGLGAASVLLLTNDI